ncbi:hypothetical protein FA15DRAFT_667123 [Coprinopsis marcescibilis]|uniref:S-adenosyl-L-methionine-dependent methyltransferase n=1 Tax=Coprinopsis marcescibilis TaxID=230819 RepID=A0A5C3LDY7_COPMA|nr:hypothetical protein FA15DRAFT_667123 [Coprinopsis marcescibilis]
MSLRYLDLSDSESESDLIDDYALETVTESSELQSSGPQDSEDDEDDVSSTLDSAGSTTEGEESVVSFPRFSDAGSVASSATSFTYNPSSVSSSSSGDPDQDQLDLIQVTPELHASLYKQEYGRTLNSSSDSYRLPADDEEMDRLHRQHKIVERVMGRYPAPLLAILQSDVVGEKRAIDLGCGNGDWIREIATDFPNCSVVGVDLIPIPGDIAALPQNVWTEIDNVNLGLSHFYNSFDVVHARLISSGVQNYRRMIDEIAHVVRPGGLIELAECDCFTYDVNHNRIDATPDEISPPWWPRWLSFFREAIRFGGGNTEAANGLHTWVSNHPAFENVVYEATYFPVIPARDHDQNDPLLSNMKVVLLTLMRGGRPALLKRGHSEETIDTLEYNAVREINESNSPMFTRLERVYAIRNNTVVGPVP